MRALPLHPRQSPSAPTYRPRSLRQAILVIEEILATCSAWAAPLGLVLGGRFPDSLEHRCFFLTSRLCGRRHQLDRGVSVARQHDLFAGFRTANEFGKLSLGFGNGDTHSEHLDHSMVHFK